MQVKINDVSIFFSTYTMAMIRAKDVFSFTLLAKLHLLQRIAMNETLLPQCEFVYEFHIHMATCVYIRKLDCIIHLPFNNNCKI